MNILKKFGIGNISGSSNQKSNEAALELMRNLQQGNSIAIIPDGPRGPSMKLSMSPIFYAQKSGKPIIGITARYAKGDDGRKKYTVNRYYCDKLSRLGAIPFVIVPMMMMVAFSYLKARKTSDFYHAIPVKRETMFFSTIVAALAWIVGIFIIACIAIVTVVGLTLLVVTSSNREMKRLEKKAQETFYLDGSKGHYLYNHTNSDAKVLWITTPPMF